MTIQSTFITTDNVEHWFLLEYDDRLESHMMAHPLIAWKIQGLDAPVIPITINGGPQLMTRSTDWFLFNSATSQFYGMDSAGCWYKRVLSHNATYDDMIKAAEAASTFRSAQKIPTSFGDDPLFRTK